MINGDKINTLYDIYNRVEKPNVYICDVNKDFIGNLIVEDLSPTIKWNDYNELSFTVPRYYTDLINETTYINPYYEKVSSLRTIFVDTLGYFEIQTVDITNDGIKESKSVTAHSYEVILGQKFLYHFKINTGEEDSMEYDQDPLKVSPINIISNDHTHSLLHLVLAHKSTNWSIGHVDDSFYTKARKFDIDGKSIYDFLVNDVAPSVNGIFVFNTMDNTINLYDEETVGDKTDVYISKENLMKEVTLDYDVNNIKTSLRVSGGDDDTTIRYLNNGSQYITDLSFYCTEDYFGEELYNKYIRYLNETEEIYKQYAVLSTEYFELEKKWLDAKSKLEAWDGKNGIREKYELIQNQKIESKYNSDSEIRKNSEWWQEYRQVYLLLNSTRQNAGWYRATSQTNFFDDDLYFYIHFKDDKKIQILGKYYLKYSTTDYDIGSKPESGSAAYTTGYTVYGDIMKECFGDKKNKEIDSANHLTEHSYEEGYYLCIYDTITYLKALVKKYEDEMTKKSKEMTILSNSSQMSIYFTQKEMEKLNLFIREDEFDGGDFVMDDNDTEEVMEKTEKALLDAAKKELAKICKPQIEFQMNMANIFALPEFKIPATQFQVGNFIVVEIRPDYYVDVRITEISYNYDDPTDFSATFSNAYTSHDPIDIHAELIKQSSEVAHKVASTSSFWQKSSDNANEALDILKNGLGESVNTIKMSDNQDVTFDRYGLHLRKKAEDGTPQTTDGYELQQGWITNNQLLFTDDGWSSAKTALGIYEPTGEYGLFSDFVVAGKIDGGSITGTTINNGNGTFVVDADGNMEATSAKINGEIKATSGYIGNGTNGWTIEPTRIYSSSDGSTSSNGNSKTKYTVIASEKSATNVIAVGANYSSQSKGIDTGSAPFRVTKDGKMYATDADIKGMIRSTTGEIGGFNINANGIYKNYHDINQSNGATGIFLSPSGINVGGGNFKVTSAGALTAKSADISGRITATSGSINNLTCQNIAITGNSSWGGNIIPDNKIADYLSNKTFSGGFNVPMNYSISIGSPNNSIKYGASGGTTIDSLTQSTTVRGSSVLITASSGSGSVQLNGRTQVNGNFTVPSNYTKSKSVDTDNYGTRLLEADECPLATFTDYGKGALDETGKCYIPIDPVFAECVLTDRDFSVFLTKYGQGDIWVNDDETTGDMIVICGTPNLKFSWMAKYKQNGGDRPRLPFEDFNLGEIDYGEIGARQYIESGGKEDNEN